MGWSKFLPLAAALHAVAAIYPDDHWDYSTKLTDEKVFDDTIQQTIDAGKTLFVRWIASAGWGWWTKQAPSWNEAVKLYAENPDVAFADINLADSGPRGSASPGAGGWPTIRYYNKETGVEGAAYDKKTDDPMCDELGPKGGLLHDYIEEAAGTSLCTVKEPYTGCSNKQEKYIKKMMGKGPEAIEKQHERLVGMQGKKMAPGLKKWLNQRIKILKDLSKAEVTHDEL